MSYYYPQPSERKSWADMSKNERQSSGMTKKEYNRQDTIGNKRPHDPVARPQPFPGPGGDNVHTIQPYPMPGKPGVMPPRPFPGGGENIGGIRPPMRPPGYPSPGMPPRAPEPRPFPGRDDGSIPGRGIGEVISGLDRGPRRGGQMGDDVRDIRGTDDPRNSKPNPTKRKKAQDFKDNYTGKVKKAVRKRKNETRADRQKRKQARAEKRQKMQDRRERKDQMNRR